MSPGEFFVAYPLAYRLALAGAVGTSVAAVILAGRAESRSQARNLKLLAAITAAEAIGITIARRHASNPLSADVGMRRFTRLA